MMGLCEGGHELSGLLKASQSISIVSVIYYVKHEFAEQLELMWS